MSRRLRLSLALVLIAPAGGLAGPADDRADIGAANRKIGRGVNLGNALEAPMEGAWGLTLREDFFEAIKQAGFDSVRIPIRWSAHAKAEAPYAIDPGFFERVDWAIKQALDRGLTTIINVHHFEEMDKDPDRAEPMLRGLWAQIAARYKDRPGSLYFELLNEPHEKLTPERWNRAIPGLLAAVRATNPSRPVIIGPGQWNSFRELPKLKLPESDRNLIVTFHYYDPFQFTHQGAEWVPNSRPWLGKTWTATPDQLKTLRSDFDKVAAWAKEHDRPVFLGEFGAYSKADLDSRVTWTRAVTEEAARRGYSSAYWEFGSGFGAYDPQKQEWRAPLLGALLPDRSDRKR